MVYITYKDPFTHIGYIMHQYLITHKDTLTPTVLVTTIDALGHFETG